MRPQRHGGAERALAKAGRAAPVLLGPFLGEIGYELQYWIPFLRRLLSEHRIAPEQATVMTRGGAALWYRDFAAHAVDVLAAARRPRSTCRASRSAAATPAI